MKKYIVNAIDKKTGAVSLIDTIEVDDDYTVKNYISDCSDNWDSDQMKMFERVNIELKEV